MTEIEEIIFSYVLPMLVVSAVMAVFNALFLRLFIRLFMNFKISFLKAYGIGGLSAVAFFVGDGIIRMISGSEGIPYGNPLALAVPFILGFAFAWYFTARIPKPSGSDHPNAQISNDLILLDREKDFIGFGKGFLITLIQIVLSFISISILLTILLSALFLLAKTFGK